LSVDSLARRLVIGLMSSLLVFIPTTAISILFRRVRPRKTRQDKAATDATPSTEAIELDDFGRTSLPHALVRNTSVASIHDVSETKTRTTVAGSNDRDVEPETVAKAEGIDNTPGNSATPPTDATTGPYKTGTPSDAMETASSISEVSSLEKPEVSPYMESTGGDKPTHTIVLNDYTDEHKRMSVYSLSSDSLKAAMSLQVRPKLVHVSRMQSWRADDGAMHIAVHVCGCTQLQNIEQPSWYVRTLLDWTVPWWTSVLLYAIIATGWIMCVYAMLLYGTTFNDEQVRSPSYTCNRASTARLISITDAS